MVRGIANFFLIYWMKSWVKHVVKLELTTVCLGTVVTSAAMLWRLRRAVRNNIIVNTYIRYRVAVGRNTTKFPGWLRYFIFQVFSQFYCCQKLVTIKWLTLAWIALLSRYWKECVPVYCASQFSPAFSSIMIFCKRWEENTCFLTCVEVGRRSGIFLQKFLPSLWQLRNYGVEWRALSTPCLIPGA